jgi:hypothetical protein
LKGFMSDTAKSFELGCIELLDLFGGHTVKLSFHPFLHPFADSCKRSIGRVNNQMLHRRDRHFEDTVRMTYALSTWVNGSDRAYEQWI